MTRPVPPPKPIQSSTAFIDALFAADTLTTSSKAKRKRRPSISKDDVKKPNIKKEERGGGASPPFLCGAEETSKVALSSSEDDEKPLKGVLVYHRSKFAPKKELTWRDPKNLTQIHYFELDETERENVSRPKSFSEQKRMEKEMERSQLMKAKLAKHHENTIEYRQWPIQLFLVANRSSPYDQVGSKSEEKEKERERQLRFGAVSDIEVALMESPYEPEPMTGGVFQQGHVTSLIPLNSEVETVSDYSSQGYPEPIAQDPASALFPPIVEQAAPPLLPIPDNTGGEWRLGDGTPLGGMEGPMLPHPMQPPEMMMMPPPQMMGGPPHAMMGAPPPHGMMPPFPPMGMPPHGFMPPPPMMGGRPPAFNIQPCHHFTRFGSCRFENKCRFAHVSLPPGPAGMGCPPQNPRSHKKHR
ncbi:unnamed protein product [Cyprideis torosa]|uniref:Uncharacterized protein n=1 Tax=Cyprideis torosa TaxID=163714 RepID=A0A7R8W4W7_9CRUS|nr:unnamed protein product [Cyprideis torosa]CAG0882269.1 unnamed protein product [Cyprideis torosa]